MIISDNRTPNLEEFQSVVMLANQYLNQDSKRREKYYLGRNAQKLEDDVVDALVHSSKETDFEGTIKKISGQKFPDIVAGKYYGVEVKSSKDENWMSLGGSINESTRVEDVDRIFLTFGKLISPIEFKSRPYEECLSEVIVTHYPRYKINMNLSNGETIFDKMDTSYDELRTSDNPVKKVINYYKSQLKEGERLWWIDSEDTEENITSTTSFKVRLWRTLDTQEKRLLMIDALAYFPNILGSSPKKYEEFSLWLATRHGVVSTSLRDTFSAGGVRNIETVDGTYSNVPQIFYKVYMCRSDIIKQILDADEDFLKETWKVNSIDSDRINQWISLIASVCNLDKYTTKQVLKSIINTQEFVEIDRVADKTDNDYNV